MINAIMIVGWVTFAVIGTIGCVSLAILAEDGRLDTEERVMLATLGSFAMCVFGMMWPLAVLIAIVAAPALVIRHRRNRAVVARERRADGLADAAALFPAGSGERRLLIQASEEARRGR